MDGNRKKIKKMKTFKESIIDIPRDIYAKVYLIMQIQIILNSKIVS